MSKTVFKSLHSSSFTPLPFLIDPRGGCVKHKPANSSTNVSTAVLRSLDTSHSSFLSRVFKMFLPLPGLLFTVWRNSVVVCKQKSSVFRNVMFKSCQGDNNFILICISQIGSLLNVNNNASTSVWQQVCFLNASAFSSRESISLTFPRRPHYPPHAGSQWL